MILYQCWLETQSPGATEWQHYEQFEEEADPPGVYLADEGMCDGVDDLAQRVLRKNLPSVLQAHTDQPDVQVRACAQVCDQTSVAPSAICQAAPDDIAEAREALRLEALTRRLHSAQLGVYEAHRSLEALIVKAHNEGLGLGIITQAVAGYLDAQSVARLIDAPALFREVQELIRTRPELAWRTRVRNGGRFGVTVELRWTDQEDDAERLRECAWNESIEDYDRELAAALLSAARSAAGELLALLSAQFEVTPASPRSVAPRALVYSPITVRRPARPAGGIEVEGTAA
ncbi:hypothetical protein ACIQVL_47405 [Streptomyces sp. NPDC090499]|uniref:hypothetical protein n=1 Tax=Streptomyces sp. NPDC090499 TaxID=3365965 RepID=UPI0037FBA8B0